MTSTKKMIQTKKQQKQAKGMKVLWQPSFSLSILLDPRERRKLEQQVQPWKKE